MFLTATEANLHARGVGRTGCLWGFPGSQLLSCPCWLLFEGPSDRARWGVPVFTPPAKHLSSRNLRHWRWTPTPQSGGRSWAPALTQGQADSQGGRGLLWEERAGPSPSSFLSSLAHTGSCSAAICHTVTRSHGHKALLRAQSAEAGALPLDLRNCELNKPLCKLPSLRCPVTATNKSSRPGASRADVQGQPLWADELGKR